MAFANYFFRNLQNKVSNSTNLTLTGGPVTSTTSSMSAAVDIQFGNNNRIRRRSSGNQSQQGVGGSQMDDSGSVSMHSEPDRNVPIVRGTAASTTESDIISMTGSDN